MRHYKSMDTLVDSESDVIVPKKNLLNRLRRSSSNSKPSRPLTAELNDFDEVPPPPIPISSNRSSSVQRVDSRGRKVLIGANSLRRSRSQQRSIHNGRQASSPDYYNMSDSQPATRRVMKLKTGLSKSSSSSSSIESAAENLCITNISRTSTDSKMKGPKSSIAQSQKDSTPRQGNALPLQPSQFAQQSLPYFDKEPFTNLPPNEKLSYKVEDSNDMLFNREPHPPPLPAPSKRMKQIRKSKPGSGNKNFNFITEENIKSSTDSKGHAHYYPTQKIHPQLKEGKLNAANCPKVITVSKSLSGEISSVNNSPRLSLPKGFHQPPENNFKTELQPTSPMTAASVPTRTTAASVPTRTTGTMSSAACGAALSLVGGVGFVVERLVSDIHKLTLCIDDDPYTISRKGSNLTLDTYGEDLQDDMSKIERMTSWDTYNTMNTLNTTGTDASISVSSALNPKDERSQPLPEVDDDGNKISLVALKSLFNRKQLAASIAKEDNRDKKKKLSKKIKSKGRKKVKFEYPPISSMKNCPRITDEERDALFFTEDELEQYDRDRRFNLNDDVEVVAVHSAESASMGVGAGEGTGTGRGTGRGTGTNLSHSESSESKTKRKLGIKKSLSPKPLLRDGKWKANKKKLSADKADSVYVGTCVPDNKTSKTHEYPSELSQQEEALKKRTLKQTNQNEEAQHIAPSRTNSEDSEKRGKVKLKGVQIYLRQRTVQ